VIDVRGEGSGLSAGCPSVTPPLSPQQERVRTALNARNETGEGVRVIAKRFGLSPTTVQKIRRPFDAASTGGSLARRDSPPRQHSVSRPSQPPAIRDMKEARQRKVRRGFD
jgi:hypothetical protein